MIKAFLIYVFQLMGYQLNRVHRGPKVDLSKLPDADCYRPFFLPWLWDGPFKELYRQVEDATLVSPDRAYTLWTLTRQARTLEGLFLECGVYKLGHRGVAVEFGQREFSAQAGFGFGGCGPEREPAQAAVGGRDHHQAG